jgi:hypothetical protein
VLVASKPRVSFWPDGSTCPGKYGWLYVIPLPPQQLYYGPGVESVSNRRRYQESSWVFLLPTVK